MPIFKSISDFFRYEKGNYRRGGLFLISGITLGIFLSYLFGDTGRVMISLAVAGYGTALVLILIGDKSKKYNT